MNEYMTKANELAKYSIENNKGGCFGCVIVKDGEIVTVDASRGVIYRGSTRVL